MKVRFYCKEEESDTYEFPDTISEEGLLDAAYAWLDDNVGAFYQILNDDNEEE